MYGAAHNIYYTKRQYLLRLLPLLLLRCLRHPLHFYHSSYYPRHDIRPASSLLVASISSYSSLSTSNPTKGRGRFFHGHFLISTSSPILLLLQTQFLNIPPFHLPKPPPFSVSISHREATGSCNIYTFYLSLPFHLLDNFR